MNLRPHHLPLLLLAPLAASSLVGCGDGADPVGPVATPGFVLRRPELSADRTLAQFGEVAHGDLLRAAFEIEVVGEHPLRVRNFNRSCGCAEVTMVVHEADGSTTPVELDREYPTGTRFTLEGTFNTIDKRGVQKQYVQLEARDTEEAFLYHIECEVKSFFADAPLALALDGATSLGRGPEGQGTTTTRVRTADGTPVRLRRGADPYGQVLVDLLPVDPDDDGRSAVWDVVASVAPGTPRGPLKAKLELVTDVPQPGATQRDEGDRFHREFLHVSGEVMGAVRVEPARLDVPLPRTDQTVSRRLLVTNELTGFTLPPAEAQLAGYALEPMDFPRPDAVEVQVEELRPGELWQVELTVDGAALAGQPVRGYVVLPIGHEHEAEARIPFTVAPKR